MMETLRCVYTILIWSIMVGLKGLEILLLKKMIKKFLNILVYNLYATGKMKHLWFD
jgi:hypothetical protein